MVTPRMSGLSFPFLPCLSGSLFLKERGGSAYLRGRPSLMSGLRPVFQLRVFISYAALARIEDAEIPVDGDDNIGRSLSSTLFH